MKRLPLLFCGVLLMSGLIGTPGTRGDATDNSGAALLWTSDHPAMARVRALLDAGEFAQAEALLNTDPSLASDADSRLRRDSLETIRRIRREYSQTEDELVAALRQTIDDFTAEDLRRLVDEGEVTCRMIDGKRCYFRREPGVMTRFCDEVKQRQAEWEAKRKQAGADTPPPSKPMDEDRANFVLNNHLADVAAAGRSAHEAGGSSIVLPMRFRVRYSLTVKPAGEQLNPELMREGSTLAVWLPFPQEYRQQSDVKLISATIDGKPYEPAIAPNATNYDGPDEVGGASQRTAYFQTTVTDPTRPIVFEEVFEYTMAGHYPVITADNTRELTDDERIAFASYLAERPPHIAFTPELTRISRQLVGDQANPYLKAKAIFDWWDANIKWMPEFEYAVIPSFATWCVDRRRGDCGVQGVTLISMMRSVGIPARWQSGFTTKPGDENMHDWTEIYLPPHGWVVADPSYAYRESDNPDVRQFYLGHMDAYRLIINLDYGRELHPPKPSLRSEPADFQRGEVEVDGVNLYFDDWKYDYVVESIEPIR